MSRNPPSSPFSPHLFCPVSGRCAPERPQRRRHVSQAVLRVWRKKGGRDPASSYWPSGSWADPAESGRDPSSPSPFPGSEAEQEAAGGRGPPPRTSSHLILRITTSQRDELSSANPCPRLTGCRAGLGKGSSGVLITCGCGCQLLPRAAGTHEASPLQRVTSPAICLKQVPLLL